MHELSLFDEFEYLTSRIFVVVDFFTNLNNINLALISLFV